MSNSTKSLSGRNRITPFQRRQGPPRKETIGASVSPDEKMAILRALERAGFPSASEGARVVLLDFANRKAA